MSHDLIDRVVDGWLKAGVALRPGASRQAINAVERLLGIRLPADLQAFYEKADGMQHCAYDRWFVSFWSCERFLTQHEAIQGTDERGAYTDISFADVMISSWYLWFRIRDGGNASVVVESTRQEFTSCSSFLSKYLEDAESFGLFDVNET